MTNAAYICESSRHAAALPSSRAYAAPADFCAIFDNEMNALYGLALVLTRSHETAHQCFLSALDDCRTRSTVFPEWARSWSRRTIVKNAIRLLRPSLSNPGNMLADDLDKILKEIDASARPYLQLPDFERFAFVMTVLEGYTVRDCAALLDSTSLAVEQARTRGLEAVAAGQLPLMTAHAGSSGSKRGSVLVID